jgi:hypothetical protein
MRNDNATRRDKQQSPLAFAGLGAIAVFDSIV